MRSIQSAVFVAAIVSFSAPAFAKHHGGAHAEGQASKKKIEKKVEKKEITEEAAPKTEKDSSKTEIAPGAHESSASEHHAE